jgi:hypothetical protein
MGIGESSVKSKKFAFTINGEKTVLVTAKSRQEAWAKIVMRAFSGYYGKDKQIVKPVENG